MSDTTSVQVHPSAIGLHYKTSAEFWERRALALQNQLTLTVEENKALKEELEQVKNPPVVVSKPPGQV